MIAVASPSKPFEYTAKATPRRATVIKMYDSEIEALYDAVDQSSQNDNITPIAWTQAETLQLIRAAVNNVLKKSVLDQDDIFQYGADRYISSPSKHSISGKY